MQSRNQRRYGAIERLERALNNPRFDEAYKREMRTWIEEINRNIRNDPNGNTHGGKSATAFKPIKKPQVHGDLGDCAVWRGAGMVRSKGIDDD